MKGAEKLVKHPAVNPIFVLLTLHESGQREAFITFIDIWRVYIKQYGWGVQKRKPAE
jgi:hypothetical protein